MFTGIVTEMGTVTAIEDTDTGRRMVLAAPQSSPGMATGESIAVNGVCLTAVTVDNGHLTVEAVGETLARSNLGHLVPGDLVDLERPLAGNGRFDGHIVQGHVDGVGTVVAVSEEGGAWRMRIDLPSHLTGYIAEKGSIAVDGVSLTVTACSAMEESPGWFEVVLIPHTLAVTVLGRRKVGAPVNLEMDVIAKYVERMMETHR